MRRQIDLNGDWQLAESPPGAGDARRWQQTGVPAEAAIPARVPGDVHLDLLRAGRIEDPLYAKNALDCRWVEARDWWFSRTFPVDESFLDESDRVELLAEGLDLTAEIWLNGQHVGSHNNQFIPAVFEVSDLLQVGENLLVIRLDVGLRAAPNDRRRYVHISSLPASGLPRMWMRKAQYSFGWDWAPRLLTCGIWRPIALLAYQGAAIRDLHLTSQLGEDGPAQVVAELELESFAAEEQRCTVHLRVQGDDRQEVACEVSLQPGLNRAQCSVTIPEPRLWWPRTLGEPFLYDVSAELIHQGRVLDRTETRFGLRTIRLMQEPLGEDEGTSFTIEVNGQPVFCQGANWAPADSIPARVDRQRYDMLLRAAAEANFNTLRIWGGGFFEDPSFYDLCDELGILVWQDFLFACSFYPDDDAGFCEIVRQEAEVAVCQLRNHACLALWCGNNENDWIYGRRVNARWDLPHFYGEKIYHEILPEVCARLDPTRPYWPSSPYGGADPNSAEEGDRHHWDVPLNDPDPVQRLDFRQWGRERAKFLSEFGMLAPPVMDTLKGFLPPDERYVGSPSWDFHNNLFEMDNLASSLRLYWGEPESLSLQEVVLASQMIQAEALKTAFEQMRRRQFDSSGCLFWAYNDCWGAVGWSIIDYYGRRKPSFYHVRRALAPLLVSLHRDGDEVEVWLTNGTLQDEVCRVEWGVLDLRQNTLQWEGAEVSSRGNQAQRVATIELSDAMQTEQGRFLPCARLVSPEQQANTNRCFLTGFHFQDLALEPVAIAHSLRRVEGAEGDTWHVHVEASAFAWGVYLQVPPTVWVEDNTFDLLPGECRQIVLRGPAEDVAQLQISALNQWLRPGRS